MRKVALGPVSRSCVILGYENGPRPRARDTGLGSLCGKQAVLVLCLVCMLLKSETSLVG